MVGALYAFGYGFSDTTFEYKNLKVDPLQQGIQGQIKVSVDITNTGNRRGDEVMQLYFKDEFSSVIAYETQLRGFERISIHPGETKTVNFTLKPEDLVLLDKNMHWTVERGKCEVLV